MKVVLDSTGNNTTGDASGAPATAPTPRVTTRPATPAAADTTTAEAQKAAAPAETSPANVTFRRDDQGQIYYVLTDAESGKEIREVPPAEIRKVGEGIADYLKQEAAKSTSRVKVKA